MSNFKIKGNKQAECKIPMILIYILNKLLKHQLVIQSNQI